MPDTKRQSQRDKEARQQQMRTRILKAAMKLFLKRGFDNVTMRNIGSEIGYSPGTIYRYFTDKGEMFFALRGEAFVAFDRAQTAAHTSKDPERRLRQGAGAYVAFALKNPEYYEMMFLMPAPMERSAERQEWMDTTQSFDLLRTDIQFAMDAGVLRKDNVDRTAFAFWSAMHGVLTLVLRRRTRRLTSATDQDIVGQVIEFLLDTLIINRREKRTNKARTK